MLYSRSWQYALRLLLHLSHLAPGEQQSARVIARATHVPAAFTGKILTSLAAAHLVRGRRGPGGGVQLARPPSQIRLRDIAQALGEDWRLNECILGFRDCDDNGSCPIHATWSAMKERLDQDLLGRSLEDFLKVGSKPPDQEPKRRAS